MWYQAVCLLVVGSPTFLECSKFNLSIQVWINTSKNISEQGSSPMPNVFEKEEQSNGSMIKSEPTPWTAAKNTI
jgi:hypothetical protein